MPGLNFTVSPTEIMIYFNKIVKNVFERNAMNVIQTILYTALFSLGFVTGYCTWVIKARIVKRRKAIKEKNQRALEDALRRKALLKRLNDRNRRNTSLKNKSASIHDKQS